MASLSTGGTEQPAWWLLTQEAPLWARTDTLPRQQSTKGSGRRKMPPRGPRHRPGCHSTVPDKVFMENSGWFSRTDTAACHVPNTPERNTQDKGACQKPFLFVTYQPSEEEQVPQGKQTHFNDHLHFFSLKFLTSRS